MDNQINFLHQINVCMLEILSLKEKVAALESNVEKFTSYNKQSTPLTMSHPLDCECNQCAAHRRADLRPF